MVMDSLGMEVMKNEEIQQLKNRVAELEALIKDTDKSLQAELAGSVAFWNGKEMSDNPFPPDTEHFTDELMLRDLWKRGWQDEWNEEELNRLRNENRGLENRIADLEAAPDVKKVYENRELTVEEASINKEYEKGYADGMTIGQQEAEQAAATEIKRLKNLIVIFEAELQEALHYIDSNYD